jgi:hypothetical protein
MEKESHHQVPIRQRCGKAMINLEAVIPNPKLKLMEKVR